MIRYFLFLIGLTAAFNSVTAQPDRAADSLRRVLATARHDTTKAATTARLAYRLQNLGQAAEATALAKQAVAMAEKAGDKQTLALSVFQAGLVAYQQHDNAGGTATLTRAYNLARDAGQWYTAMRASAFLGYLANVREELTTGRAWFQKSHDLAREQRDTLFMCKMLTEISRTELNMGNYVRALDRAFQDHKLAQAAGLKAEEAAAYSFIGGIYLQQEDYDKAWKYLQLALPRIAATGNLMELSRIWSNLGAINGVRNQGEAALKCFQTAVVFADSAGRPDLKTLYLGNIAMEYQNLKRYPEALAVAKQARVMADSLGMLGLQLTSWTTLAGAYLNVGQPNLALPLAEKAFKAYQETDLFDHLAETAQMLAEIEAALGHYSTAYDYQKKYIQFKDSVFHTGKSRELGQLEARHQIEMETTERKQKEAEAQRIAAEEEERRNNMQYLTIFAGLIGIFAGLVFMGRLQIPIRLLDGLLFAGLLLTFEFLLVLFDPLLDRYSHNIPVQKLLFNSVIAFAFAPAHAWIERTLRLRMAKAKREGQKHDPLGPEN